MTKTEASAALHNARAAQALWGRRAPKDRCQALKPLRHAIIRNLDDILKIVCEETGKPPMDALAGDVMVTLEQLLFYERKAPRLLRTRTVGKPPFFYRGVSFREFREPHGVALIFAPWNYPLQLSVIPLVTALVAGNASILKCSEKTPRTAKLIRNLCEGAGLPQHLVQIFDAIPEEASLLLDAGPDFVFFTGSNRNGLTVAQKAAALMIPSVMELGGKDAALVFDSCNLDRAVAGITYGAFSNAGQVCVGIKRIYVQQGIYEAFLGRFVESVRALRIGQDNESDLGEVSFPEVRQRLQDQIEDALRLGAKQHTGESSAGKTSPVVLTEVPPDAGLMKDESFGPAVCVAPFQKESDAIALANSSPFGLSASIWTGDKAQGERVAAELNSGSSAINDVIRNIANPHASFGGNGFSGYGRYHGDDGLRAFSRVKTVMTTKPGRIHEINWFPFRAKTFRLLGQLMKFRHGEGGIAKRIRSSFLILAVFLLAFFFWPSGTRALGETVPGSPGSGSLTVDLTLPPNAHGRIAYLVFASAEGFPDARSHAVLHDFVPLAPQEPMHQRLTLGTLSPGRYAVTVYLDENGNGKLDKNWIGIPKEPVGASNNPKGRMGPPHFNECSFTHGSAAQTIAITLVH